MKREYYREYYVCLLILALQAALVASLPIIYQQLFENALPRLLLSKPCMADVGMTVSFVVGLSIAQVWLQYKLDTSKMDGARARGRKGMHTPRYGRHALAPLREMRSLLRASLRVHCHCACTYLPACIAHQELSHASGAGFVPLFQKDLCRHITRLPQLVLDGTIETDLLAMMEKDVHARRV